MAIKNAISKAKSFCKRKPKTSIMLATLLTILLYFFVTEVCFTPVLVKEGRSQNYIEEYDDCYLYVKWSVRNFFGSHLRAKIYFLPGQKKKMLAKIREDVVTELEKMMDENGDYFTGYEISDDFRKVHIYEVPDFSYGIYDPRGDKINPAFSRIGDIILLYSDVKNGRRLEYDGSTFIHIENDSNN